MSVSKKEKNQKKKGCKPILWAGLGLLGLGMLGILLLYFLWLKPNLSRPLAEVLNLPADLLVTQEALILAPGQDESDPMGEQGTKTTPEQLSTEGTAEAAVPTTSGSSAVIGQTPVPPGSTEQSKATPTHTIEVPAYVKPTIPLGKEPICGEESEWIVLLVGVDYQGDGYLYGLADVIRLARIDFINGTINMLVLPRDLLVEVPVDRLKVEGPIKINQGYLFGTPGMGHYVGTGYGPGSLAEVIQYNFGVSADHYAVINFKTFVRFIDSIGGVEVDLPQRVTDPDFGTFPAGRQWLDGEQALNLARIRMLYSDAFRVNNQTLIIRAVLNKMIQPAMILKVPGLLVRFKDAFLTDLSIEQLTSLGLCFLNKFDTANLRTFAFPFELAQEGFAYIPTLSNNAFVYHWDLRLVDWIHETLVSEQ